MKSREQLYTLLKCKAIYSLSSHNRDLVFQTHGAAKMAYDLGAITQQQFKHLNDMLLRYWLNDPESSRLT